MTTPNSKIDQATHTPNFSDGPETASTPLTNNDLKYEIRKDLRDTKYDIKGDLRDLKYDIKKDLRDLKFDSEKGLRDTKYELKDELIKLKSEANAFQNYIIWILLAMFFGALFLRILH
eukprot:Protomagalhaensia_wolfi_Nauph_80__4761@NODE_4957_length_472_cov_2_267898_g4025_i0_p1_GENE_NODE_4957_length_472_cov_2_267898_g4025_i0NODE_4957_length_472_cov_2_267898_g4025_i0_p1_ORF_typecomplete_len118_score30_59DUF1640/PF07798_11/4_1e07betaPIX_CC/PF16523_5/7_2betaPIX_CC/PF16523_5/0_006Prominin/PF05478_11/0_042YtxH/PF12732_7/0_27AAA_34/PF13872_6/41AAA_34/PF13872_6/3_4Nup54_C/PF18437_1/5_1e02Nup54_C/PF18437_1/83Nup54_C/PF18437_1/6_6_NODE_4957_length_472_cov_2_267898_g4025_i040393